MEVDTSEDYLRFATQVKCFLLGARQNPEYQYGELVNVARLAHAVDAMFPVTDWYAWNLKKVIRAIYGQNFATIGDVYVAVAVAAEALCCQPLDVPQLLEAL